MKKIVSLAVAFVLLMASTVFAAGFKDVSSGDSYYEAVYKLSSDGVISGYTDGTFRPENSITRAEAASVIVRAARMDNNSAPGSAYSDVPENHWARKYIMIATKAGILSGTGGKKFQPDGKVTYNQMLKMVVCMRGLEETAVQKGGWPMGYAEVAYGEEFIDAYLYNAIKKSSYGSENISRGEMAEILYKATYIKKNKILNVGGKNYYIGMQASSLGTPDERLASTHGFTWHVYGTANYENFLAAGVHEGRVVALSSAGKAFDYNGYKGGSKISSYDEFTPNLYTDSNDNKIVHAVLIIKDEFKNKLDTNSSALAGESKMVFHYNNAFRLYHGLSIMKWSDNAAKAARLHSEDMATGDYFEHQSSDGRKPGDRIQAQGIRWKSYGENITAGRKDGINAYNSWVNSSGHRTNMLGNYTYLGVGGGFKNTSTYGWYFTQNFYR